MHLEERAAQFGFGIRVFARGQRHAVALRQQLQRLHEADPLDLHHELEHVATHAAPSP